MGYGSSETFARELVTIACTMVYTAEFTMSPQGDATIVAWAMRGPAPFANLKGVAEK